MSPNDETTAGSAPERDERLAQIPHSDQSYDLADRLDRDLRTAAALAAAIEDQTANRDSAAAMLDRDTRTAAALAAAVEDRAAERRRHAARPDARWLGADGAHRG